MKIEVEKDDIRILYKWFIASLMSIVFIIGWVYGTYFSGLEINLLLMLLVVAVIFLCVFAKG